MRRYAFAGVLGDVLGGRWLEVEERRKGKIKKGG